jgi:hypothetical protein
MPKLPEPAEEADKLAGQALRAIRKAIPELARLARGKPRADGKGRPTHRDSVHAVRELIKAVELLAPNLRAECDDYRYRESLAGVAQDLRQRLRALG